jgi:diguanylate cyclase (GGDEF)-like protein/PAS domain S-box-containing protein
MNISYAVGLLISAITSATIALIAWKRRSAPGASGLMLSMFADLIWAGTYAVRWMMVESSAQLFWLDATYFGVAFNSTFLLIFTLQFTGRFHLLTRRNLGLLAIVPLVTLFLLWTDGWHGLFFGGQHSTGTILSGGPAFWFFVIYTYTQIFIVIGLWVQAYLLASSLYRLQNGAALFAACLPVAANIFSFAGFSPFPNLDLTPFIFTVSGLIYAYALFGLRMLDVVPIARHKLVDEMTDGIIVLDASKRIVDINPAVQRLIGISSSAIGQSSADVLSETLHLDQAGDPKGASLKELRISEDPPRDFELQILPLLVDRQNISGYLLILRDITERKQIEELLRGDENRFRSMFEMHGAVMLLIEPATGQILNANYSAEKFYGYPREYLCKMNISDINILPPEEILMERKRAVANERNYFNFQHRLANGNIRRVEAYSSPLIQNGKPILFSLIHDVTDRKQAEEKILVLNGELEKLASIDGLTGINNHRSLLKLAEREFDVARRYQSILSMMFFDIDNFKQINDAFGHAMGDEALKKTIQAVCSNLRSADLIGRYGGDEFVILLPQTAAQDALPLAERIHASIAEMRLDTNRGALTLTISIGIAQSNQGTSRADTVEDLLHRSDMALYAAKQAGKNCTMIFDEEPMGAS